MSIDTLAESMEQIFARRRSVRGYLNKQVPAETLNKIFNLAQRTPSNCNTQPWVVHVVSGEKLETLRKKIYDASLLAKFELDFPYNQKYEGIYKERQYDAAARLYDSMSIRREDKERRGELFMRNFSLFGAPHAAFLFLPEQFGLREAADVGMYAQSLMLILGAFGLGSCPQTSLGFHANLVRDVLEIDPSQKLLFGISFGYEDVENPINNAKVGRAELGETTFFHA